MELSINNCIIQLRLGNMTQQPEMEAIVNPTLLGKGGTAGDIDAVAGPELEEAASKLAPVKQGEAVITKAFNLPNQYIIHCRGPVYGLEKPEPERLATTYRHILELAEKENITSLAVPAISTGHFEYPTEEATDILLETMTECAKSFISLKKILLVVFSEDDFRIYKRKMTDYGGV